MLAVGVSVAVHVIPPSAELTADNVPLAIKRSLLAKPVTASEKVIVTREVSPMIRELSATTIAAVGRTPSTKTALVEPTLVRIAVASVEAPSRIVPPLRSMLAPMVMPSLSAAPTWTVLRKTSALVPLPERYVAYTVVAPSVRVSRGVPPLVFTVTLVEKLTVKSRFCPAEYVPFEGTLTLDAALSEVAVTGAEPLTYPVRVVVTVAVDAVVAATPLTVTRPVLEIATLPAVAVPP